MTSREIKYSLIIPFTGDESYILTLLESIDYHPTNLLEIIIVSSRKLDIKQKKYKTKILQTEKTLTYPMAVNWGVNYAKGEFLIFCDADTYLMKGALDKIISFYHSSNKIGVASSKLLCPYNGTILDFGIGFSQYNSPHIGRDRVYTFPLFKDNRKVQAACSANMMVEKKIFLDLKGFNEDLPYSYCDLDFCLRLKSLRKEIWVVGDSIVFHRGNSSNLISSINKSDIKGKFWALNQHRINIDMDIYFKESFRYFQETNRSNLKSYFLLDLSTVVDCEWHYNIFISQFNLKIADLFKSPASDRDLSHIPLYGFLNWNILKLRYPIIYFVDRFRGLIDNTLWWHLRNAKDDLVIDRNGNIDTIKNILN